MERHADPIDRACSIEQEATADAIQEQRRLAAPEQVRGEDGQWETYECIDCGEPIGNARVELGKVRCIQCQKILESKKKRGLA